MLSRSKSAPDPLNNLGHSLRRLQRSPTAQSLCTPTTTSLVTRKDAREDPFSLVGFFPSCLTESQQDWHWIRSREDESDEYEHEGDDSSVHQDLLTHSMRGLREQEDNYNYDDFARQVIDGEDKFGMLAFSSKNFSSLRRFKMPMFDRPASPQDVRPFIADEPLDLDALHTKHCSRRETLINDEGEQNAEIGQLFFSEDGDVKEGSWAWIQILFARMASLGERGYERIFPWPAERGSVG